MNWLYQTWLALWNYDPKHLAAFGVLGIIAGQAVLALPNGPIKTTLVKFLHGAFPSIQMMANGYVGRNTTDIAMQVADTILQRMETAESAALAASKLANDTTGKLPVTIIQEPQGSSIPPAVLTGVTGPTAQTKDK